MSKEIELLKRHCNGMMTPYERLKLLKETEQLLAQQQEEEQKPVAWRYKTHNRYTYTELLYHELEGEGEPLYTTPQKREPLSDDEVSKLHEESAYLGFYPYKCFNLLG